LDQDKLKGRGNTPVPSRPLRFNPSAWQLVALDAACGAAAYALAMWLRFIDEGVPGTYLQRLVPWLIVAALVQVGVGELMNRLRSPGSRLARRPVAPYVVAALAAFVPVVGVNELIGEPWHLPRSIAFVAPVLAAMGSTVLRLAATRTFEPEELLARPIVRLDVEACAPALAGKRVLITGGAGSIGAELARQVLAVGPAVVLAVDMNETGLFELEGDLAGASGGALRTCIADVADERRMHELFRHEQPQVVFHAAAYKHVPLVEANPDQAFVSNVLGTLLICEAAAATGAERVVVISTDKAVNPLSFMGLTKRVAELIASAVGQTHPTTTYSVVRFGNVLGSRGSVVPTFLRQIDAGGPITITHADARRFFMTLSEAASLVLLSSVLGSPGGVFVLEMGDDVRITDLAGRLARLRGLRLGHDIGVVHTGLRPGEKLREELVSADESMLATSHSAVRRVVSTFSVNGALLVAGVRELDDARRGGRLEASDYGTRLRELIDSATSGQDEVQVAELVP
jgi:FlaA1/EpsC-like NDP-sugar epimerase